MPGAQELIRLAHLADTFAPAVGAAGIAAASAASQAAKRWLYLDLEEEEENSPPKKKARTGASPMPSRTQSQRSSARASPSYRARLYARRRRTRVFRRMKRRAIRRARKLRRWLTPQSTVSPVKYVKMHYVNMYNPGEITLTANEMYWYGDPVIIHANSPYLPCSGSVGGGRFEHCASQYNYYAQLYQNYEVVFSKIKFTWHQLSSFTGSSYPYVVGAVLNHDTAPAMDSFEQLSSRLNCKYKVFHFNTEKRTRSVKLRFSARRRFNERTESNIGDIGSRPALHAYYQPFVQMYNTSSTAFPPCTVTVHVTYYVKWFNRFEIGDMPAGMALIQTTDNHT